MSGTVASGTRRAVGKHEFAKCIDHTLLKPYATGADIDRLCAEAMKFDFWSVCVGSFYVKRAAENLRGSGVKVCAVVGFPLGFSSTSVKLAEAETAIGDGADEIDMVMNLGAFKSGDYNFIFHEIEDAAKCCHGARKLLKVIIECCYLTNDEKVGAARLAERAGADYVKTSTGFGTSGATVEDVALLKKALAGTARIKAAGGIGTLEKALEMIKAGADRIGTSSSVKIMEEWKETADRGLKVAPRSG
ncbi:MAG: deoxyribose-phosphate aldolase [Nitrososphaerales archaeon]|nr:deoxyribose-phosphate aldolase [Nitrososphaerales archaeon]